jgi:large subunit ribosomal protein L6
MSRIGKKPVPVPGGVTVQVTGRDIHVSGPKGKLHWTTPPPIQVALENKEVVCRRADDSKQSRALHGLSRALIANMVKGVSEGYAIGMEVRGTGYNCKLEGRKLLLNCGFSGRGFGKTAQFEVPLPEGVDVKVEVPVSRGENEPAKFTVSGPDKQAVGQFAAEVRKLRKPEPYKGKGIRYAGEHVHIKAGKVFAGGAGGG